MGKKFLRGDQMSDAVFVDEAAEWARDLTRRESRGPGDEQNAWRRLETRYGIAFGTFWGLRYRKPKTIVTSLYFRIRAAYDAERERQARLLRHETEITEKIVGPDHIAVRAARAVAGPPVPAAAPVAEDDPMEFPKFLRRT